MRESIPEYEERRAESYESMACVFALRSPLLSQTLAFGKAGGRPEDEEAEAVDAAASHRGGNGEWATQPAAAGAHGSVPVHANPGG